MAYINGKKTLAITITDYRGKSAYEYAVEGGYTGTEAEYAELLAYADLHYLYRVQEKTMNLPTVTDYNGKESKLVIMGTPSFDEDYNKNLEADYSEYIEYKYYIMHPKTTGKVGWNSAAGTLEYVLITTGVTEIASTFGSHDNMTIDLTLFMGAMPFPSLGDAKSTYTVLVPKGRKAELAALPNWAALNIVEVETGW